MRGFNVATFVNILIVGLVALTISLFVFAGPKTRKTAPWLDSSRDAVVERDAQEGLDVGAASEAGEEVEPVATEVAATETVDAAEEGVVGKARNVGMDALFATALEGNDAEIGAEANEESGAEPDVASVAEIAELDSLFADAAVEENVADVEAEPVAVESDADEDVELDSLFAEDAVEESVADDVVAVEENIADDIVAAEPVAVEVVELDSLFADAAVEENVADVAVAEPVAVEVVELDSLFADAAVEENVADVAVAEPVAVEENIADADAEPVAVEENVIAVESDAVADAEAVAVEENVADAEPVAVEVVELDSLFADAAVEENVADDAVAEPVVIEENIADAVDEPVAVESDAVAEPVAVEVVELDSLFADAAVEENVADVADVEPVAIEENIADAVESDAVAVAEPVAVEENVADVADAVESDAVEENVADVADAEPVAIEDNVAAVADAEPDAAVEENVAEPVAVEENVADVAAVESDAVAEPVADAVAEETDDAAQAEFVAVSVSADANETNETNEANETIVATDAEEKAEEKIEVAPSARENEFWILGQAGNGFYLYRLQGGTWVAKDAADFYADSAEFATVVYAHGYQTDMNDATRDAAAFKTVLDAAKRNVGAKRAFRLVVWKWNSERDAARIRIDAQAKATLADQSGKALGRFLNNVDENADLALVGFSFGARVVGSALETLAKNDAQTVALDVEFDESDEFAFAVSGKLSVDAAQAAAAESYASEANVANVANVADAAERERKIALILVAAACDLGSFEARGVYGRGATLPTAVLNVYNPNDFALKYYRHVSETRSDAQGVAPIRAGLFPNAVGQTFNINSNPTLGKRHAFVDALGTVPTQTLGALAF